MTKADLIEEVSGSSSGPLILLTGLDDEALDGLALRAGAADYLLKNNLTAETVTRSIRYAVETWKSQRISDFEKERFRALYSEARRRLFQGFDLSADACPYVGR